MEKERQEIEYLKKSNKKLKILQIILLMIILFMSVNFFYQMYALCSYIEKTDKIIENLVKDK